MSTLDEAIEAAATGWARLPWSAVGAEGEARANESRVTVRCLVRPDGSVPDTEDEPDLVAILAGPTDPGARLATGTVSLAQ